MSRALDSLSTNAFRAAFVLLALFIPFSIAGDNFAIGLSALAWTVWVIDRRGARVRPDGLAYAAIVLALSAVPSVLLSEDTPRALRDWTSYWELAVLFMVGAHVARVRAREPAFWTLMVSAALASGLAFVQRAGGIDAGPIHIGAEHRAGGTLHTMTFAGVLYQLVLLAAAAAMAPKFSSKRRWLLLVASAAFTALLFTMTRGAWLALIVGLIVLCALLRTRILLVWSAAVLVALFTFSFVFARDQGRTIAVTEFQRSEPDRNVSTRLVLWDISLHLFREHPWFGVGMGDYTTEADRLLNQRKVRTTVDTHNVYLHLLATRGLFGFIPFVVFFVVLIRSLAAVFARAGPETLERYYAGGALAVTAAVLTGALTENNVDDSEVSIAFMFIAGLARSAIARETPPAGSPPLASR